MPRCHWRMGRIEELIPARDGLIRGVKLKIVSKTEYRQVVTDQCRKLFLSR